MTVNRCEFLLEGSKGVDELVKLRNSRKRCWRLKVSVQDSLPAGTRRAQIARIRPCLERRQSYPFITTQLSICYNRLPAHYRQLHDFLSSPVSPSVRNAASSFASPGQDILETRSEGRSRDTAMYGDGESNLRESTSLNCRSVLCCGSKGITGGSFRRVKSILELGRRSCEAHMSSAEPTSSRLTVILRLTGANVRASFIPSLRTRPTLPFRDDADPLPLSL
jgi:hypothetical protein